MGGLRLEGGLGGFDGFNGLWYIGSTGGGKGLAWMADILLSSLLLLSLLSSFIPMAAKLASSPVVDLSLSWRSV